MDQQLVRDTIEYLSMIFATVAVFALIPWAAALACRARGHRRRCTAALATTGLILGLPLWSAVMQTVVPGQSYLGQSWWMAFILLPATLCVGAGLLIVWRGPDRRWAAREHLRATLGSLLCGLVGLILVWQHTDQVWGWATAMAGCGPVAGTADWVHHRAVYRRLWWGNPEAWSVTDCARRLDQQISRRELGQGVQPDGGASRPDIGAGPAYDR